MELRYLLVILWRRKWIVLSVLATIFFTITIITALIEPWYDASAKVLLRKSPVANSLLVALGMQGQSASVSIGDTDRANYLALSMLKPVIERAIEDKPVTRVRTRVRIVNALPFLKPVLGLVGVDMDSTTQVMTAEDLVEKSLTSMIFPRPYVTAEQYEDTNIIEIEAKSPDPEQAEWLANAVAEAFIAEELERIRDDFTGAKAFIERNIEISRGQYEGALETLTDFKERGKTVNLESESQAAILTLSELNKELESTRIQIVKERASINNIEGQLKDLPMFQKDSEEYRQNEFVTSLKNDLKNVSLDLAEAKSKYTSSHPDVVTLERKKEETESLLRAETQKIFGSETHVVDPVYRELSKQLVNNYTELESLRSTEQAIPIIISEYEKQLMKMPEKFNEYSKLNLSVTVTQDIYDSMLKYLYQVGIAESIALSDIYLVEPAVAPELNDPTHRHPSMLFNVVVALFLGTLMAITAAFLVDYLDNTIKSTDDLASFTGLTYLGNIMKLKAVDDKLLHRISPKSPVQESFRTIRNSIKFATVDRDVKSLAISSTMQSEGKSFFTSNIAISFAKEGKRVLILDGDLRRPSVHKYFDISNAVGVTNYLVGDSSLGDIKVQSQIEGLTVIPTGPIPPDPARLVESRKMEMLIHELEGEYDLVIVDTPPLYTLSDALFLGRYTDGLIMVIQYGRVSREQFKGVLDTIGKSDVNLIGTAMNMVSGHGLPYYYYYYSQY